MLKQLTALFLAILCLTGPAPMQDDPPPPIEDKQPTEEEIRKAQELKKLRKRIRELIQWVVDDDPELNKWGRDELLKIGREAIPVIEEELRKKAGDRLYEVFRDLLMKELPDHERWVMDEEVKRLMEKLRRDGAKLPKGQADKYVKVKFMEAHLHAQEQNYQRSYDIIDALITLEPRSRYIKDLKTYRRWCDHRITQTTIIKAEVLVDKTRVMVGDKVIVRLRMENVSPAELTLHYAAPDAKKSGRVITPVNAILYDPKSSETVISRHLEFAIDNEVPIATGAQWEHQFTLDTGHKLFHPESDFYREFVISAWSHPQRIETGGFKKLKKVVFEPVTLKVVPRKYGVLLDNPLEWLGKLTSKEGKGNWNEVFAAAMLLEGEEKKQGIELLVSLMENAPQVGRNVCGLVLYGMTRQRLGTDPAKWRAWIKKGGEDKDKEK